MKCRLRTMIGLTSLTLEKTNPFNWEKQVILREAVRMNCQLKGQAACPNQDFKVGQSVRVQSTMAPKTWTQKVTILEKEKILP